MTCRTAGRAATLASTPRRRARMVPATAGQGRLFAMAGAPTSRATFTTAAGATNRAGSTTTAATQGNAGASRGRRCAEGPAPISRTTTRTAARAGWLALRAIVIPGFAPPSSTPQDRLRGMEAPPGAATLRARRWGMDSPARRPPSSSMRGSRPSASRPPSARRQRVGRR
jgi:hypothetical protein